ncbi:MAG TPA: hypothetical protein VG273_16185 [Bryobacteraceae bacterium]|jgi:hypothetical protein|nr:hypothetical protein [Bryobacteraceae bacterium]
MKIARLLCLSTLATGLFAAENPPDAAVTGKLIDSMRESALSYDSRLPDFICTQTTHREIRREPNPVTGIKVSGQRGTASLPGSADVSWRPIDEIEQQVTYFGHKETYKLVSMNGKAIKKNETPPPGVASTGEFGSTLGGIFDPRSHADFEWKRWDKLRGHPVYVFSFSIAKENSAAQIAAGTSQLVVGYHGFLFVDREDSTIMRVTTEADIPPDFPLQHVTHLLDYGQAIIAGERYLVPLHSEMESRVTEDFANYGRLGGTSPLRYFRNKIDFKAYRKYGVESSLKPE